MYSPKIREDLIPKIYRAAKGANVAMTKRVNRVIEKALAAEPAEDLKNKRKKFQKGAKLNDRLRTGTENGESGE